MKILWILVLSLSSFSILADISVLSDLDDTIKISKSSGDVTDYVGDDVFTGIPEFFQGAKDYSSELFVLSASPEFLRSRIINVLAKRKIKYNGLILRSNIFGNKYDYKVKAIKKIFETNQNDFIFLGDDLGDDPEVYAEIKRLYPERVLGIYIRSINGRAFDSRLVRYWTSFDLFLREFLAGRMRPAWIELAWEKLMTEVKMELIFPKKAHCPSEGDVYEWQMATVFQPEAFELMNRMSRYCQQRQSDIILP